MASFVLSTVTAKLPALVEKFEPELESGLRTVLKKLKTEHPDEAVLFLTNWTKINKAVQQELVVTSPGATAPSLAPVQSAARRKRTRRTRRHRR
jgi:hypothetical protein